MKRVKILFGILLLVGVGLIGLTAVPNVHAAASQSVTATYYWKDMWGATVMTTQLTQNWEYTGSAITWHSNPQYTWSKAWWAVFGYGYGIRTGTWVEHPGWYNIGWGTGHFGAGIPTPFGTWGFYQSLHTEIGYYGNGVYWTSSGFGYLA